MVQVDTKDRYYSLQEMQEAFTAGIDFAMEMHSSGDVEEIIDFNEFIEELNKEFDCLHNTDFQGKCFKCGKQVWVKRKKK